MFYYKITKVSDPSQRFPAFSFISIQFGENVKPDDYKRNLHNCCKKVDLIKIGRKLSLPP